jgi:carbamoyl-phosphate synthase large subunit
MNVLLASAGRRGYLVEYFREAVRPSGKVVATNSVSGTSGMLSADVACVVPEAHDPTFIDKLLEICRDHSIGLLFSLHDWEAPFIAAAANHFQEAGVCLGVSSPDILDVCLDKLATWKFCHQHGIATPRVFSSETDAIHAYKVADCGFPLIVKARFGQGSLALFKVYTEEELKAACLLARAQIARFSDNGLSKMCEPSILIQEFIDGEEYGLDIVNDFQGEFRACLAKKKLGMRAGETDSAISVCDHVLTEFGRQIGTGLRHVAMLDADVIVRDGKPYLIEMNPRFGGHYPFSHIAGANVPAALVAWARNVAEPAGALDVDAGIQANKNIVIKKIEQA